MRGPGTTGRFGWFKGVFTPSLLTILGVIMYLRLGWVVGHAGLGLSLVIISLSTAVTLFTGLSIAATATNMNVGVGGAYFLISRSLGLQAGAAVGLPLFFAQALGVSFYVVGFAESVCTVFPTLPPTGVGIVTLCGIGALAWRSADLALKAQYVILAAILLSLLSFFLGGPPDDGFVSPPEPPPLAPAFWVVFAVFFPAVTGIEAGVAMSGDLRNPARALPLGTVLAVVTGYVVYVAIAIVLARWVPRDVLVSESLIMQRLALVGQLVLVGVWGATLSSALGALLGAPRTLQALAKDRILPERLGHGTGADNEPRLATVVAFCIALVGVALGTLNVIAPVLSMFFLTSYAFLNLSAGLEGLIGSPSWRPRVRTPWWLSLAGAALCVFIMFMINAGASFVAIAVCATVYYLVSRRRLRAYFGDMRHGLLTLLARWAIYRLAETPADARSWRPNLLVLSGSPASRWYLVEMANALVHRSGFVTIACVVPDRSAPASHVAETEKALTHFLKKREVSALVEVHVDDDVLDGACSLVQSSGIGPLEPNTVMLGETEDEEKAPRFARLVRLTSSLHKNLIIVCEADTDERPARPEKKHIHLWWGRERASAGFMLALAYLLQTSEEWFDAELHIFALVPEKANEPSAQKWLDELVRDRRIRATATVVADDPDRWLPTVRERSSDADLILLPLRQPRPDESDEEFGRWYLELNADMDGLPATALVLAAERIDFDRIFE